MKVLRSSQKNESTEKRFLLVFERTDEELSFHGPISISTFVTAIALLLGEGRIYCYYFCLCQR